MLLDSCWDNSWRIRTTATEKGPNSFWTKIGNARHSDSSAATHCNAMPSDETFNGETLFPFFRKGCVKICQKTCVISEISKFTKTENLEALRLYSWDYAVIILHVIEKINLFDFQLRNKKRNEWIKKILVLWIARNWSTNYTWSNFELL